ncbi:hypothetical protein XENOCAPTIV_001542 [Xenoophorus captivus]|uniref:Uncharacterized protein n=1 Tax=Xenoophorus captivus TaxID=1517983 RepID=A0ABV0S229_9TELE
MAPEPLLEPVNTILLQEHYSLVLQELVLMTPVKSEVGHSTAKLCHRERQEPKPLWDPAALFLRKNSHQELGTSQEVLMHQFLPHSDPFFLVLPFSAANCCRC